MNDITASQIHIKGVTVLRSTGTQTELRCSRVFVTEKFHFALPQVGFFFRNLNKIILFGRISHA